MPMPLIPDIAVFQRKLATLPLATYQAGERLTARAALTTGSNRRIRLALRWTAPTSSNSGRLPARRWRSLFRDGGAQVFPGAHALWAVSDGP
jgi:hypothetical protein